MSEFAELERYGVLLTMAEVAFREIEGAVGLEFCNVLGTIFAIIPCQIAFGVEPEDIHQEVLTKARRSGFDPYVLRLRQRCEERYGLKEA